MTLAKQIVKDLAKDDKKMAKNQANKLEKMVVRLERKLWDQKLTSEKWREGYLNARASQSVTELANKKFLKEIEELESKSANLNNLFSQEKRKTEQLSKQRDTVNLALCELILPDGYEITKIIKRLS